MYGKYVKNYFLRSAEEALLKVHRKWRYENAG